MYDFDKMIDRRGTGSLKWNVPEDQLPMWVADMDFQTAPEITEALRSRVNHGIFGYSVIPETWYDAVLHWWESRHHFKMEKEWLVFAAGVIPVISSTVRRMTKEGDAVLVLSPVYNHFYISIEDNGRTALESRLCYEDGQYFIDWADFEEKLARPETTLLVLSNPHNPTGNIWERETLERIGVLCKAHGVLVLADEIHCDLTDPGWAYTPYASVSELCAQNSIICAAPTKTFNIAGLQTAVAIIPNPGIREKVKKALEVSDVAMPNAFAITAAEAAYRKGGLWLDALRRYIAENKALVTAYIEQELPQVKVVSSHATYLMWLDFSRITEDGKGLCKWIRQKTGLYMNLGDIYRGNGTSFARLNVACPKATLRDAMQRLACGIASYEEEKNRG